MPRKTLRTPLALAACVIAIFIAFFNAAATAATVTVSNDLGGSLSVDGDRGDYTIRSSAPAWEIGGTIGKSISDVVAGDGQDALGAYREVRFKWTDDGRSSGWIRLYRTRHVCRFSVTFEDAVDHSPTAFPALNKLPDGLLEFRYGDVDHLRPESFHLAMSAKDALKDARDEPQEPQYGGPFALFDERGHTMILSPASDFMVAQMSGDPQHGLRSGLNATLKSVPAGYTYETILAIGDGINATWDTWGTALTDLYGKKRPANDADVGLKYLGYWTDNGGGYYYNYDLSKGYEATLLTLKQHLDERGIPIRYLQLDSWWYPKTFTSLQVKEANKPRSKDPNIPAGTWNRYGGLLEYTPHPDLFPGGLSAFRQKIGIPLITHNRWIDPESPYRQAYKISGIAAVDPAWWKKIIGDIADWGVVTYEQDWNNYIYLRSPELATTTGAGEAYMDGMARACAERGLTMQYCMVLPRHLMQGGAKYANLTTVRVSGDRFDKGKYREFLYGSRMAAALGVWPWTDTCRSGETGNVLVSSLSAGMVGISDKIGEEDPATILQSVRADGVIVKPDVPLLPTDATYIAEARHQPTPIVCTTRSANGENTASYVFASKYNGAAHWSVDPSSLGLAGPAFVYDYFGDGTGSVVSTGQPIDGTIGDSGWAYRVVVPVDPSGMAFIGDVGKFVTRGKKRVENVRADPDREHATILLAGNEPSVTLAVYAPAKPDVQVQNGAVAQLDYDAASKIARAKIVPDKSTTYTAIDGERAARLDVTFSKP